jgi:predicted metal-dependent peptidase
MFKRPPDQEMSSVYSVRIPKRLKKEIETIEKVDWQSETRRFLEKKVRKERLTIQLQKAKELRRKSKKVISGADLIREDRELGH